MPNEGRKSPGADQPGNRKAITSSKRPRRIRLPIPPLFPSPPSFSREDEVLNDSRCGRGLLPPFRSETFALDRYL